MRGRTMKKAKSKVGSFASYLTSKGISVFLPDRVKLTDVNKIQKLELEYRTLKAQEDGLPDALKSVSGKVFNVHFDSMERENQDPTRFGCELVNSSKNYDDDTWNGTVRGTMEKIWEWALAESGLDPQEIEDAMTLAEEIQNEPCC